MANGSNCVSCGLPARYNVQLAVGPNGDGDEARYYIPNDFARGSPMGSLHKIAFCGECMRAVEDNMRATIRYLQQENQQAPKSIYDYGFLKESR